MQFHIGDHIEVDCVSAVVRLTTFGYSARITSSQFLIAVKEVNACLSLNIVVMCEQCNQNGHHHRISEYFTRCICHEIPCCHLTYRFEAKYLFVMNELMRTKPGWSNCVPLTIWTAAVADAQCQTDLQPCNGKFWCTLDAWDWPGETKDDFRSDWVWKGQSRESDPSAEGLRQIFYMQVGLGLDWRHRKTAKITCHDKVELNGLTCIIPKCASANIMTQTGPYFTVVSVGKREPVWNRKRSRIGIRQTTECDKLHEKMWWKRNLPIAYTGVQQYYITLGNRVVNISDRIRTNRPTGTDVPTTSIWVYDQWSFA